MRVEERENSLHCLKVMVEEANCEDCKLYGTTGTDHCERDCVRNAIEALEQEPCEDCISRQEVLDEINEWIKSGEYGYTNATYYLRKRIGNLQSVNPQKPKTGHWISRWYAGNDLHFHVCSECNEEFSCDMETGISIDDYHYCPNCGAKMVEPQESEDQKC